MNHKHMSRYIIGIFVLIIYGSFVLFKSGLYIRKYFEDANYSTRTVLSVKGDDEVMREIESGAIDAGTYVTTQKENGTSFEEANNSTRTVASIPEPASYANRVESVDKESFINNNTVFHIAQYTERTRNFFVHIYPEYKDKILDSRTEILHKADMLARAANSTEHDAMLVGGPGSVRPGMRPKHFSGEWLAENWKGKIIFLNGEPWTKGWWSNSSVLPFKNQYHIGFLKNGCQSLRVNCLTQQYGPLEKIWDFFRPEATKQISKQEKFLIYVNRNCVDFREEAFDSIAAEFPNKTLEYGSECHGAKNRTNVAKTDVRIAVWNSMFKDMNRDIFNHFRFCLVMENHYLEGYVTEKIMNAFMGGCIPIYYGSKEIFDIFNPESFIFYNISNPQPALNEIRRLEYNATAYGEVMKKPILRDGENTIQKYFSVSDNLIPNAYIKKKVQELTQYECKRE